MRIGWPWVDTATSIGSPEPALAIDYRCRPSLALPQPFWQHGPHTRSVRGSRPLPCGSVQSLTDIPTSGFLTGRWADLAVKNASAVTYPVCWLGNYLARRQGCLDELYVVVYNEEII